MNFDLIELAPCHYEATRAIYNFYITNTNATPEGKERSRKEHEQVIGDFLCAYVACEEGQVRGFAFIKPYAKGLESFDPAVEIGVYMHHASFCRGGGSQLAIQALTQAMLMKKHTAVAKIDADNLSSIALFSKLGFQQVAFLREIGLKRGVRVTVVYMQLMLSGWNPI